MKRFMVVLFAMVLNVPLLADYTYEISSGYFGTLTLEDSETLLMTGGGGMNLMGGDDSILDIRNTSSPYVRGVSGIADIMLGDNSQLYISGGTVHLIDVGGEASVVLTGGQINVINGYYFSPADPLRILVHCQPGWTYQNGYLSGLWNDNTTFNIKLVTKSGSDVFDNMTIIPEPATLLLLGLGSLLIRRK